MGKNGKAIVGTPSADADLYWACRLDVPDPCALFEIGGKRHLILSDLEIDRGKRESKTDKVLSLTTLANEATAKGFPGGYTGALILLCQQHNVTNLEMPESSAAGSVDKIRAHNIEVTLKGRPFYAQRFIKNEEELKLMRAAQKITFKAINLVENILKESTIGKNNILRYKGSSLTSEFIMGEVEAWLARQGYYAPDGMIVAGGIQSTEPHNHGSGPLRANEAIIVDIFPRSRKNFFFGDATRTFCKGKPSPELVKQYNTVKKFQENAFKEIKSGIDGKKIHATIQNNFTDLGYQTGVVDGKQQGFFHGTGHGLGIGLHEEPLRIGKTTCKLVGGNVVTVEPGLYYPKVGGVRIEDVVVVTKDGCELLATYPKRLQVL